MYNDTSQVLICGISGVGGAARGALNPAGSGTNILSCNPNYSIGQIGLVTRWTPVKNLTFGVEATYSMLDQQMTGTVSAPSPTAGKPAAIYELKDQNTWILAFRAQRNW